MRTAWLLAAVVSSLVVATMAQAQGAIEPTYSRTRLGAEDWQRRGGGYGWHGRPGGFGGYYSPYFAPPLITSSYYERPYPYHFDYFRGRWDGVRPTEAMSMPSGDCPCASGAEAPAAPEVVSPSY